MYHVSQYHYWVTQFELSLAVPVTVSGYFKMEDSKCYHYVIIPSSFFWASALFECYSHHGWSHWDTFLLLLKETAFSETARCFPDNVFTQPLRLFVPWCQPSYFENGGKIQLQLTLGAPRIKAHTTSIFNRVIYRCMRLYVRERMISNACPLPKSSFIKRRN